MKNGKAESSLSYADLLERIEKSATLKEIDSLREDSVFHMHQVPEVLKIWQDKYWSLKICPTCGHEIEN